MKKAEGNDLFVASIVCAKRTATIIIAGFYSIVYFAWFLDCIGVMVYG